jgi:hypothetical protein
MNAEQFEQRALVDRTLANYLDEVVEKAEPEEVSREVGVSVLLAVAAYALYRIAKNHFDQKRGLAEAELRDRMLDQVERLVKKGWSRDQALATVEKISKEVASLRSESPAIKAALAVLKGGNEGGGA